MFSHRHIPSPLFSIHSIQCLFFPFVTVIVFFFRVRRGEERVSMFFSFYFSSFQVTFFLERQKTVLRLFQLWVLLCHKVLFSSK
ncbi:hypothetical protein CROQUDRAFT_405322 [Cronartium quercuum f. sp. fusiforme G11]|uniref:Uncharacterized protein n=1 Tax=Cronartium quercuum f. sp. fusiforme G11 TaxID=708437 RepID=A0A9P6NYS7_9BASI|nr:hypothetical protein CROQUDRAFT_405322 [Cronartium quercuum f. sp. fusiforme G11]